MYCHHQVNYQCLTLLCIHNFISGYLETIDILIVFNEIWEKGVKTTNVFGGWYVLYDSSI